MFDGNVIGHLGLSGRSSSAPAVDESKGMIDTAYWVTNGPALGGTLYMYGDRPINQSPGQDA